MVALTQQPAEAQNRSLPEPGSGRYPYSRGKHLIVVVDLWSYTDESGIERDQRYCLVAGYVAAPITWDAFSDEWRGLLQDHKLKEFKSSRYFRPRKTPRTYLGEFLDLIERHHIVPVGHAIEWDALLALPQKDKDYFSGRVLPPHIEAMPYVTTAMMFVAQTARDIGPFGPERVRLTFIFDDTTVYKGYLTETYYAERDGAISQGERDAEVLGPLNFDSSIKLCQLQAADLLSGTWRHVLQDGAACRADIAAAYERARKGQTLLVWHAAELRSALDMRTELHYGYGE